MSINLAEVKKQIEYYLSDSNLAQDNFFREKIQSSTDGYLSLDLIMNCKKIQKLGVTLPQELVSAIEGSTEVELNEAKDSVRRIGNKEITVDPEFAAKAAEKLAREQEKQELVNYYENFQPLFFSTACETEGVANWRNVTEALLKQHSVHAPYCRFGKQEGNFALNKDKTSQEVIDTLLAEGIKFGEATVTVKLTEGEALTKFYELHGRHYNGVMDNKKKDVQQQLKAIKTGKEQKKSNQQKKEKRVFEFGGEKYSDILTIKNLFKGILGRTASGQKIIAPYHDMLKALLAYHEKGQSKLEQLDHFTVDIHPEYKDTRCFFVVKTDGSREDFSAVKCLTLLEQKLNQQ